MRKFLLPAIAAIALSASSAFAADIPQRSRAPAPVAPPIFTWTGFYVGLNVGGAWGESKVTRSPNALWSSGGFNADVADAGAFTTLGSRNLNTSGFTGGLTIGYNVQSGSFVYGIEGDINYLGLKSSSTVGLFPVAGGNPQTYNQSVRSTWLATLRPRIGYAAGRGLYYITGGLAVADSKFSGSVVFTAASYVGSVSKTLVGWTVGAGVEYAFSNSWSGKAEYLYVDLGKSSFTGAGPGAGAGYTIGHSQKTTLHIFRVGLNYHFGGAAGSVVAKY